MENYYAIALLSMLILIYSLFAGKIERKPVSSAIIFLLVGIIGSFFAIGVFKHKLNENGTEIFKTLAELSLALVLYTDASKANLRVLKNNITIPSHLLLVGLPITIILGFIIGLVIFPEMGILEIAILATVLAPTDAALGEPVVSNRSVPAKIREGINVESGLNDGICVPILLLLLALHAVTKDQSISVMYALGVFVREIGVGAVVGAAIAYFGWKAIKLGFKNDWIEPAWKPSIVILMAFTSFGLAQLLGGSGFIASYVGGLVFNANCRIKKHELLEGAEGVGKIMTSVVWLGFGSFVLISFLPQFTPMIILYSLASLTVIRILPVLLCLVTNKISSYGKFFIAWFGPRGLASIVFAAIVLENDLPHGHTIILTAACTILMSVFAHGVTAGPMSKVFTRNAKKRYIRPVKK